MAWTTTTTTPTPTKSFLSGLQSKLSGLSCVKSKEVDETWLPEAAAVQTNCAARGGGDQLTLCTAPNTSVKMLVVWPYK